jgi:hypothetical protein
MRRSHPLSLAAAAIAFGAIITATAPIANAEKISENTIKSECKSAGGKYTTGVVQGTRFTACTYTSISGNKYKDYYVDGQYYSTSLRRPRLPGSG